MNYLQVDTPGCMIMVPARFLPVVGRWCYSSNYGGWWTMAEDRGLVLGLPGAWVVLRGRHRG